MYEGSIKDIFINLVSVTFSGNYEKFLKIKLPTQTGGFEPVPGYNYNNSKKAEEKEKFEEFRKKHILNMLEDPNNLVYNKFIENKHYLKSVYYFIFLAIIFLIICSIFLNGFFKVKNNNGAEGAVSAILGYTMMYPICTIFMVGIYKITSSNILRMISVTWSGISILFSVFLLYYLSKFWHFILVVLVSIMIILIIISLIIKYVKDRKKLLDKGAAGTAGAAGTTGTAETPNEFISYITRIKQELEAEKIKTIIMEHEKKHKNKIDELNTEKLSTEYQRLKNELNYLEGINSTRENEISILKKELEGKIHKINNDLENPSEKDSYIENLKSYYEDEIIRLNKLLDNLQIETIEKEQIKA